MTYNTTIAAASHGRIVPSHKIASKRLTASEKKPTSRKKGPGLTWNGLIIHMDPTTQDTMKVAAPKSSPIARLPESAFIAEKVEKTSGLPFPKAKKVTPATFSSRPRSWAMVARLGVKKSEALIPKVENRNISHAMRAMKREGRRGPSVQK